ncbi:MAG: WYL domain-containing protein [Bacteroidales bacterium]|nr:WYL domain-containing protein [Bacteroidales bacterium]
MKKTDTFRQYIWLVHTIQRARRISYSNIKRLWIENDLNDGKPLTRTTFYRLRQAIDDMFGICIECDNRNQYYITNPETLKDNSTPTWMLQTLTVNNVLFDSLSIKDRLVLEKIPKGMEYLDTIITAIKSHQTLLMGYQKFTDTKPYTTRIEPYCLKLFHQRWYLLGKSERKSYKLAIYALDRMTELKETESTYILDPDFDAETFFNNYFGVFIGEEIKPAHIVLRAYGKMIPLLRTLPKHQSQKEINTQANFSDFEYYIAPTLDFKQEILKEGPDLEVLEPESLRNEIVESLMKTIQHYQP